MLPDSSSPSKGKGQVIVAPLAVFSNETFEPPVPGRSRGHGRPSLASRPRTLRLADDGLGDALGRRGRLPAHVAGARGCDAVRHESFGLLGRMLRVALRGGVL